MSNLSIRYLHEGEFNEWNSFVEKEKDGKIFHHSEWLSTIFRFQNKKIETKVIACYDKNNNIIGGIAFGSQKKMGIRLTAVPILTSFSGILISHRDTKYISKNEKYRENILRAIINLLEEDHKVINFSLPPEINDIRVFNEKKYETAVKYTYITELYDFNDTINNFDPSIKRQIKKAEKQEITVLNDDSEIFINDFYHLHELSMKRQNHKFKLTQNQFITFINYIKQKKVGQISFFIAYLYKKPIAGQAVLYYKDTAYYWLAGGNPEYFNTGVNQLIMKKVFEFLFAKNIRHFDFVGANTLGISDYKASFNFNLIPYYQERKNIGIYAAILMELKKLLKK